MVLGSHPQPGGSWRHRLAAHLPAWLVDASAGFVAGVLSTIIVLGLLTWKAQTVAELTLGANPTCASPYGLRQVGIVAVEAGSTQAKVADGDTGGEVSVDPQTHYVARFAVDDASNTVWIPEIVNDDDVEDERETGREPEFLTADGANQLSLSLQEPADVRLVCVVNGAALWYISYQNFGRVRTVKVWGDDGDKKLGILQSLGSEEFPNAQVAGRNLGDVRTIHIEVVDAYAGIQVENFNARACLDGARVTPEDGKEQKALDWFLDQEAVELAEHVLKRWPDGCILEPKVKAGIAEVRVYATD